MKEFDQNIQNIQGSYSSEKDEYSFTVSQGQNSANVILKLDTTWEEVTQEDIVKGLVKYISTFEDILTWQSEN